VKILARDGSRLEEIVPMQSPEPALCRDRTVVQQLPAAERGLIDRLIQVAYTTLRRLYQWPRRWDHE
jgi:hypothetical protein